MKIAILSMQRVINCGSVLQAYSLKKILEDILNQKVDFLDPEHSEYVPSEVLAKDKEDYTDLPYISGCKAFYVVKKGINKYKKKIFEKKIKCFQKDVLELSSDNNNKNYDVVVEGSDEVFKSRDKIYLDMHGELKNANKIITYAASCGSVEYNSIPQKYISRIKKAMNNFEAMSVRDDSTYEYVRNIYTKGIEKHLDPVLVGNLSQREHKRVKDSKYILVYAYGDRIRTKNEIEAICKFAKEKKLKTIAVGSYQYWCDKFVPTSPFETLDYFYHADYVVTDTFHGAIFSIINNCKFAVILRESNKNKINMLLSQLGLSSRIVGDMTDIHSILDKTIDYNEVKKILDLERKRTYKYLEKNIQ